MEKKRTKRLTDLGINSGEMIAFLVERFSRTQPDGALKNGFSKAIIMPVTEAHARQIARREIPLAYATARAEIAPGPLPERRWI